MVAKKSTSKKDNKKAAFDKQVKEAQKAGRFLLTVSYCDPKEDGRIRHYHWMEEFPNADVTLSLQHIASEIQGAGLVRRP